MLRLRTNYLINVMLVVLAVSPQLTQVIKNILFAEHSQYTLVHAIAAIFV